MNDDILFGIKGLSFTPGEQGFPKIVAPGARPAIGTGSEMAGLGSKYTSYWWNATKGSGSSVYDMAAGAINYANPNNIRTGGIHGTGIGPKFYGMTDSELINLGKNPNLKGSIVFSQIPKKVNDELVSGTFAEPGFGSSKSASGIQSSISVKPNTVMKTPDAVKYVESGASYRGQNISPDVLKGEEFHDWMQDFAKNIKAMGVADEDLPSGAKELLQSTRTSEYESAIKKYLMEHENPKFRKTADQLEGLRLLSRDHKLAGREDSVLAYKIGDDSVSYASKANVEKIVEMNRNLASSTQNKIIKSTSSLRGKISSTILPKTELQRAIRPVSSQTSDLLSAASQAAKAVSKNDSTAMRLAGAATSILRRRII